MIRSKHITVALHVLIWSAILFLPYVFISPPEHYTQVGPLRCSFFTLTNILHIGLFYFNAFFLYPKWLNRKWWWLYLISLAVLVLLSYLLKDFIVHTWFASLAKAGSTFGVTFFPSVFFLVLSTIYRLVLDKINHEKEQTKHEADKLVMELKFLRTQVSPHFLFNVLNNLVSMARHRSEQLEPSLIRLSGLMRYMLYESDERIVSVEREIEYLKSYIELQKLRFEDDVEIITDIDTQESRGHIEPMLLIPFVENAFKHGVTLVQKPFIHIVVRVVNNTLLFNVKNRFGDANQSKDKDSGIGLANIKARLNLLYPGQHKLSVEENDNIFHVNLSLQLK